ncbi:MAG: hypothetical protein WBB74_01750 [Gaiellaceae bacterium]
MAELERELDRLYGLPLNDFTAARNELVRNLKKEGNSERAAEVAALKKPSASAWVLNQLARKERTRVKRLLRVGDELRKTQERALGGGHADELRQAVSAEREAVRELVQAARGLADKGSGISDRVLERVRASLSAVAGDEEARDLLERGRSTTDFERLGFPALSPTPGAAVKRKPTQSDRRGAHDELAERRQRRADRQQRLQALKERLRELRLEAAQSRREARRAEGAYERAMARATELEARVERAQAELAEAEAQGP